MYIEYENTDTHIIPVIGNEDAWIIDTYLPEEEGQYFKTGIDYDGSISLTYSYTRYDGNSGCMVEIFLRKDGVLWDEAFDTLPPRYDEYKVALTRVKATSRYEEPISNFKPALGLLRREN